MLKQIADKSREPSRYFYYYVACG